MSDHPEFLPEVLAQLAGMLDRAAGGPVPSLYRYVLSQGETFTPAPLPAEFSRGPARQCFHNALTLCISRPDLRYVEGFGLPDWLPMPIHHGWCVTGDGTVVDPTWENPEDRQYHGVVIPLAEIIERGRCGILEELAYEAHRWTRREGER